jgi:Cof subfamily protein (haloacid dehalogenase superfamily)
MIAGDGERLAEGRRSMAEGPGVRQRISLLLADVDGTLVTDEKILTERARAAVHHLHEAGILLAITSGRPPRGMAMLIEPLALKTPIAAFNGGVYVKPDLSISSERTLTPKSAKRAFDLIRDEGLDAWVYSGNDWFIHNPAAPHVEREAWTVKFRPTLVGSFGDALQRAAKIVGVSDDHDLVQRCESDLRKELGAEASAARSQPYYVDVTHPEANKGAVVDHLSAELGIPSGQIATIGDSPNDVLMFRKSGFSIAMGNASDEVKRQAHAVTDSYKDEGFAKAVERFVLGDDAAARPGAG